MKMTICVMLCIGAISCTTRNLYYPVDIDLERISKMSPIELDQLAGGLAAEEIIRTKRSGSGSGDILGLVAKKITSGISGKISALGQASAGASSLLSGGSHGYSSGKGHDDEGSGYEYGPTSYSSKGVDFWTLKKSILSTLFEAVKAIVGGATIIKGQLIKGGGALAAGVGKLVSSKGDAVSNLGRHIVKNAWLAPPKGHRTAVVHHETSIVSGPTVIHSAPSAPAHPSASYGSPPSSPSSQYLPQQSHSHVSHYELPTAPSSSYYGPHQQQSFNAIYGPPSKYSAPLEGKYNSASPVAGIFLLKPFDSNYGAPESHSAPAGPPGPFVTSAMHALKGILGGPTGHSSSHVYSDAASAPSASSLSLPTGSSHYTDPILHPPPPIHQEPNSYNSFSRQDIPSFKPLDIPNGKDNSHPTNSYGAPVHQDLSSAGSKLQIMVDSLLGEFALPGSPLKNSRLSHNGVSKSSYSSPVYTLIKKSGLNSFKVSKINANLDKLKFDRSDTGRSLSEAEPMSLYKQMAIANEKLEAVVNAKEEDRTEPEAIEESPKEEEDTHTGKTTVTNVDKAISYELRGNKIVRLTDKDV